MATKPSRSESGPENAPAGKRTRSARTGPAPDAAPPASAKPRRVTAPVYNAFIAGVDLESIRLSGADIRAATTPRGKELVPAIEQSARYAYENESVLVTHELTFSGRYKGEDEPAVLIRAEFEVRYSVSERMTDEIFHEFRIRNLPLNTWPYFREFVHAALARTGWPVFALPVYKAAGAPLAPAAESSPG